MAEQEQNRTEQATPFKLSEAKKRGQVAKSLDFNTLIMVGSLLIATALWGGSYWEALCNLCHDLFANASQLHFNDASSVGAFADIASRVLGIVLPFAAFGV